MAPEGNKDDFRALGKTPRLETGQHQVQIYLLGKVRYGPRRVNEPEAIADLHHIRTVSSAESNWRKARATRPEQT